MRHDAHYIESLTTYSGAAVGRMIPVEKIRPNPDQPRKALGDLRELTESIREKGVLEPLLVRYVPREECYYIISGERRYHASRAAGLREVPCIEKIADDAETLELALIENIQRKDLTPFEEADGLHRLATVRIRSEEHTSELQSRLHLVCRLLLEKKKKRRSARPRLLDTIPTHGVS